MTEATLHRFLVEAPLAAHPRDSEVVSEDGWVAVINRRNPGASGNEVLWCDRAEAPDDLLARARTFFAQSPFKWAVIDGTRPVGMAPCLREAGFSRWRVDALRAPVGLPLGAPRQGVTVERVADADLDRFVAAYCQGWEVTGEARLRWASHFADTRIAWRHYLGRVDGQVAGTASTVLVAGADYGYLFGAQVFESARGNGLYKALTAARLEDLKTLGRAEGITLARSATSAPRLQRWGFETAFSYTIFQSDG